MSDSSDLEDPPSPPVTESQEVLINELVAQWRKLIQRGIPVVWRDSNGCVQPIQRRNSLPEWLEHQVVPHRWISPNTSILEAGVDGLCLEDRDFKKVSIVGGEVHNANKVCRAKGTNADGVDGLCLEDRDFKKVSIVGEEVHNANEVWKAKGTNAEVQHILKLIPDLNFRHEEVLAHNELQHACDDISKLMLVRKDGDKWALHIELIPEGELLSKVCDEIEQRAKKDPELVPLVPQFALCYLQLMLKVWHYMRQKSWAHMDLTGENILISKETLRVLVIDFGSAIHLSLGGKVSSRMISDESEQDYADILHWFTKLTAARNCTEIIMPGDEKERTTSLFGRCQEITNQHGRGYTSPDSALHPNQIQQLLFPGEVAFRCFLEAMVLRTVDKDSLTSLKGLLEGLLEGNNPAAILDMHHEDIGLLTSEDVKRIDQTLQNWGVLDSSNNRGPSEQFLERLKQAVSGATDHDYENIPSRVRRGIDVALETKMMSIIKKTMSKLFPKYYEERAVDGQQPVGETNQQGDTEVPRLSPAHARRWPSSQRQGVSQAATAVGQLWSSENFQAPVAAGLPLSSQHGGPQVAVPAQHPSDPFSASEEKPEAVGEAEAATLTGDQGASNEGAVAIREEEENI